MPLTRKLATKSLIKQNTNQDTIGTGVTNLVRDAFTGTGSQTIFTLTAAPQSAANTQVFISGVYQNKNTYTISGATLTFSTPPPNGTTIEVISGTNYSIGVPGDATVTAAKINSEVSASGTVLTANGSGGASFAYALPPGSLVPYAGNPVSAPSGYLYCDGASYPTASYPALFAAIGYTYGGAGANFNVPDTRGIFLRGAGSQTIGGITYSGTVGTKQGDQFQGHLHQVGVTGPQQLVNVGSTYGVLVNATGNTGSPTTDGVNGTPRTGSETRPANIGVNYIIKI